MVPNLRLLGAASAAIALSLSPAAHAQGADLPPPAPTPLPPGPPGPTPAPGPPPLVTPPPSAAEPTPPPVAPSQAAEPEEEMSEGRRIVSDYNSGFQWGISPGVVFSNSKVGFALGGQVGYGFDTRSVILVPEVQVSALFLDPVILTAMPALRVIYPLNRFAPFVEGGVGVGNIFASPSQTGAALMGGGGFMIHFTRRFALGAQASYQTITGTAYKGFSVGPILAIGF